MAEYIASQGFMPSGNQIPGSISLVGALSSKVPKPPRGLYARRIGAEDSMSEKKEDKDLSESRIGEERVDLSESRIGEEKTKVSRQAKNTASLLLMVVIILITIIIFVTVIAAYDVIREKIANRHAEKALKHSRSKNKKEDIERTLIANKEAYKATVSFATFAVIIAIGVLPILFIIYYKLVSMAG